MKLYRFEYRKFLGIEPGKHRWQSRSRQQSLMGRCNTSCNTSSMGSSSWTRLFYSNLNTIKIFVLQMKSIIQEVHAYIQHAWLVECRCCCPRFLFRQPWHQSQRRRHWRSKHSSTHIYTLGKLMPWSFLNLYLNFRFVKKLSSFLQDFQNMNIKLSKNS